MLKRAAWSIDASGGLSNGRRLDAGTRDRLWTRHLEASHRNQAPQHHQSRKQEASAHRSSAGFDWRKASSEVLKPLTGCPNSNTGGFLSIFNHFYSTSVRYPSLTHSQLSLCQFFTEACILSSVLLMSHCGGVYPTPMLRYVPLTWMCLHRLPKTNKITQHIACYFNFSKDQTRGSIPKV